MSKKPLEVIEEHFSKVNDPRKDRTKHHQLIDIIAIAICAIICGAEGWIDIELFGNSKIHWFCQRQLEMPIGWERMECAGKGSTGCVADASHRRERMSALGGRVHAT